MKLLHDVAPADGGKNKIDDGIQTPEGGKPAAPLAATIVANAPSERERELAAELERARNETAEERKARVEHERTICEMQDEHHRYRKTVEKAAKVESKKNGWTFFD